jgi:uracil-DNA glycosylase family 4
MRDCPIPGASSWCDPEGSGANGVLILGEACGESEARDHLPFRPYAPAGSVLERAIRRCGFDRSQFVLFNVCPVQPPKNFLEGAPYESEAIEWGKEILKELVEKRRPRCILALGNIPLRTMTGLAGEKLSVSHLRGWPVKALSQFLDVPVVASFHPSFLRRGAMALFSVLMHDLKLAVAVANSRVGQSVKFFSPVLSRDVTYTRGEMPDLFNPVVPAGYTTYPTETDAWRFYEEAEREPKKAIAYDIETPRSTEASENDSDELPDRDILSIQFSHSPRTGLFLPWREPFIEIAKRVLRLPNPKIGANSWRFDDPLLEAHGCRLNGERHDIRWAFHHLQPDLRGSLQFIASFYNEGDGYPWKHLHHSAKEQYGILDVDWLQRIVT